MVKTTAPKSSAKLSVNKIGTPAAPLSGDRLLDRIETNRLLGLKGNTTHTLRSMAARGQLEAVRLNARVLRFRESSVLRLIEGRLSQ